MARSLLIRGMLVGLLAGLLMFTFGKIFGEFSIDRAIAFEAAVDAGKAAHEQAVHDHATAGHDHAAAGLAHQQAFAAIEPEPELVSRSRQSGIGLLTGVMVYGTAFGGLFALVFAYAYGRLGMARPQAVAALLAAGGFLAISVVPMIIYPSSPPAIGQADTIAYRTALYFMMIAISVAAVVGGVVLRTKLVERTDGWTATLSAVGVYVVVIIAAATVLPGIDEVPSDFPATVLWHFRLASMGLQSVMWSTLGVGFGLAAEKLLAPRHRSGLGVHLRHLVR
jgi:hypothetical protein